MEKQQLIFLIKQEIQKQSPTQDGHKFVHGQYVNLEIAKAYDTLVNQFFASKQFRDDFDLDYFSKTYTEKLKKSTAGQLYVTLPAKPLALLGGLGIRLVKPKDSDILIARISESQFINLKDLEAFCCSPRPFCYVDNSGNKIILQANRPEYSLMDDITVKLLPKFNEFDDSDEINTPGGDYQLSQLVLEIMGIRPTDNTNDDGN